MKTDKIDKAEKALTDMTDAELAALNKTLMAKRTELMLTQHKISDLVRTRGLTKRTTGFISKLKPDERARLAAELAKAAEGDKKVSA